MRSIVILFAALFAGLAAVAPAHAQVPVSAPLPALSMAEPPQQPELPREPAQPPVPRTVTVAAPELVPPPPPLMLASWSAEVELRSRLARVNAELSELRVEDRRVAPTHGPLAVTLAGAGIGVASGLPLVVWGIFNAGAHSSPEPAPRKLLYVFAAGQIAGAATAAGGLGTLAVRMREQPNRARVKALEEERAQLRGDLKQERKERRRLERLSPEAAFSRTGGSPAMRLSF